MITDNFTKSPPRVVYFCTLINFVILIFSVIIAIYVRYLVGQNSDLSMEKILFFSKHEKTCFVMVIFILFIFLALLGMIFKWRSIVSDFSKKSDKFTTTSKLEYLIICYFVSIATNIMSIIALNASLNRMIAIMANLST